MDWFIFFIVLWVAVYAAIAVIVYTQKMWPDHISFYGPIMMIRTDRVGFFDWFTRFKTFLRLYGSVGVIMVVVVSVLMTFLLLSSLQMQIVQKPEPTAVNDLKNIFAFPGVNDFIPLTFAVILGLIVTMVIHEFGHAILCRIEGIRVKSMGLLVPVIPIGAFVEPDEEDLEKTKGLPKMRMLGAGITNNMIVGFVCFAVMILLVGTAVPLDTPLIKSVYADYPAATAGIAPDSVVRSVNGMDVTSRDQITAALDKTRPGNQITLVTEKDGVQSVHTLTLSQWPTSMGNKTTGFMGVTYYDAPAIRQIFTGLFTPFGFLLLLAAPIEIILNPVDWGFSKILMNESVDVSMWSVPFPFFWQLIQVLFWCGWWNLAVGTFNALPVIPLDGGYITKEGFDRILDRKGLIRFSNYIMLVIGLILVAVIVAIFTLPWIFHPGSM